MSNESSQGAAGLFKAITDVELTLEGAGQVNHTDQVEVWWIFYGTTKIHREDSVVVGCWLLVVSCSASVGFISVFQVGVEKCDVSES